MNKEIAQQILDALKSGADMVSAELPLVAAQLINWIIAENAIWVMLALIVGTLSVRYHRWWNAQEHRTATGAETIYWVLSGVWSHQRSSLSLQPL